MNGLEILGRPKTVRLQGQLGGKNLSGPLEVWVAALATVLTPDQKAQFVSVFEAHMRQRDDQATRIEVARVVADIPMPKIGG